MEWFLNILDTIGVIDILIILLSAAAVIRIIAKAVKGKRIDVPPVGVMNDLPSSITGVNKYSNDMAERSNERAGKKTE